MPSIRQVPGRRGPTPRFQPPPPDADTPSVPKLPRTRVIVVLFALSVLVSGSLARPWDGPTAGAHHDARVAPIVPAVTNKAAESGPSCPEHSILSAYFDPGSTWDQALTTASIGATIIVNVNSGPGSTLDPAYLQVVTAARATGVALLGYIDTGYAAVSRSDIDQQIGAYRRWYGITDIYFDDVSSSAFDLGYYRSISQYVRDNDAHAEVMLNPGTYPDRSYMSLGDMVMDFEGTYASFLTDRPPPWVYDYPATDFSTQVSAVPAADVTAALALSIERHSASVYLTDHTDGGTLYQQLPTYWTGELQDIEALCPRSELARSTPSGPGGTHLRGHGGGATRGAEETEIASLDIVATADAATGPGVGSRR